MQITVLFVLFTYLPYAYPGTWGLAAAVALMDWRADSFGVWLSDLNTLAPTSMPSAPTPRPSCETSSPTRARTDSPTYTAPSPQTAFPTSEPAPAAAPTRDPDWWLQKTKNARGWPFLDCRKVKDVAEALLEKRATTAMHQHYDWFGGNDHPGWARELFGFVDLSNVTNSSHLWGDDSPLHSKRVTIFQYQNEGTNRLLRLIESGTLTTNHAAQIGYCSNVDVFVDEFLEGLTIEGFQKPECLPNFQKRLDLLVQVMESIVDLNDGGWAYGDWKMSQWRQTGKAWDSRVKLVDIEGAVYTKPINPFSHQLTVVVSPCRGFYKYSMCHPSKMIAWAVKHRPNFKSNNVLLKRSENGTLETPWTDDCRKIKKLFWPEFQKTFDLGIQETSPYLRYQSIRFYIIIKMFLEPKGGFWMMPEGIRDQLDALLDKSCDLIEPITTKEMLGTIKRLRDTVEKKVAEDPNFLPKPPDGLEEKCELQHNDGMELEFDDSPRPPDGWEAPPMKV